MEVTGSIELECDRRLTNLYCESHKWLVNTAIKVTKNRESGEDMVGELYEYLHKKKNPLLFWGATSYNLKYCSKFLKHRYLNKVKKLNRTQYFEDVTDTKPDTPYDIEMDYAIEEAHNRVIKELKHLEQTKLWPQAKIFSLYWMSSDTLDEVANNIGISKSTTFLAVRKIRKYLEQVIDNPFNDKEI